MITVNVPDFPVIINGQQMENIYNQYPLLVYKNITYFPMAYDYARFLGVKANWYENKQVLFVGITDDPAKELKKYTINTPNKKTYTATIANYYIAVNTTNAKDYLNNKQEEYPVLNFRNVTYFPLTWHFAVEKFGWDYSWDSKTGLQIKSSEPFRPVIEDKVIGATLPSRGIGGKEYFYHYNYYVGYPINTFNENYDLIVRKKGEAEKIFSLKEQLKDGDYYFNQRSDTKGIPVDPISDIAPSIDETVFSIVCRKVTMAGNENVLLKIDLNTGQVLVKETIPPR